MMALPFTHHLEATTARRGESLCLHLDALPLLRSADLLGFSMLRTSIGCGAERCLARTPSLTESIISSREMERDMRSLIKPNHWESRPHNRQGGLSSELQSG